MAKVTLSYELDYYEDREVFNAIVHHDKIMAVLTDVDDKIRSRLKYQEPSEAESKFLEELRSSLWDALNIVN